MSRLSLTPEAERADEHLQRQGRECGGGSTRRPHEGAAGGGGLQGRVVAQPLTCTSEGLP